MHILVTGAAGFIGSNLVHALNARGESEIIAVDDLTNGDKFTNLVDCAIADYWDKDTLFDRLRRPEYANSIRAVLHQGACSDTTERNGRYMLDTNYRYSLQLLEFCRIQRIPLIYASSAAVYGANTHCREAEEFEAPLNVYGYSKLLFDRVLRRRWQDRTAQVVGLRYFNVYGPRERHKGRMASVAFHFFDQFQSDGRVRLFEGSHGYANGEQRRDFVSVDDCVKVNLYFLDHPERSAIVNVGTGPCADLQRGRSDGDQLDMCRTRRCRALARRSGRGRMHRIHSVSRGPQGQIPGIYRGRSGRAAEDGIRAAVPDRAAGRGALLRVSAISASFACRREEERKEVNPLTQSRLEQPRACGVVRSWVRSLPLRYHGAVGAHSCTNTSKISSAIRRWSA